MITAAHDGLIRDGLVSPVESGGSDERLWLDCDLASLAENRLGDLSDPRSLNEARRADWIARATSDGDEGLFEDRCKYQRCYWLNEGGERVGTIAVSTTRYGANDLRIESFYVFPTLRGRGVGRRALQGLKEVLAKNGHGLRLDTSWSWQRTVRFYLHAGLWIYGWKRDLTFFWYREIPRPLIEIGEREASLAVEHGGVRVVLAKAHRRGQALKLARITAPSDRNLEEAYFHADSTLVLTLALEGWGLVRSKTQWEKNRHADAGPPEALAYKICIWEAIDRHHGWLVETPRIPGLEYPTWQELRAR